MSERKRAEVYKTDGLWYYHEIDRRGFSGTKHGGFASKEGAALAAAEDLGPTTLINEKDDWGK